MPLGPTLSATPKEFYLSDFGRSVNPISTTRGTDYAHLITTGTPGFSELPTALHDGGFCFLSRKF